MTRKLKILITGIILSVLTTLISCYFLFKGEVFEVIIERAQIQETINSKLPFQKTYFIFFQASVDSAQINLENGSERISIDSSVNLNVTINKNRELLGCSFVGSGKIRYEKIDASFYLDDLKIESLNVKGIPAKYQQKIGTIAESLLKDHFAKKPVYRLNQNSLKIQLTKAVLHKVNIINGRLHVYLGY